MAKTKPINQAGSRCSATGVRACGRGVKKHSRLVVDFANGFAPWRHRSAYGSQRTFVSVYQRGRTRNLLPCVEIQTPAQPSFQHQFNCFGAAEFIRQPRQSRGEGDQSLKDPVWPASSLNQGRRQESVKYFHRPWPPVARLAARLAAARARSADTRLDYCSAARRSQERQQGARLPRGSVCCFLIKRETLREKGEEKENFSGCGFEADNCPALLFSRVVQVKPWSKCMKYIGA